jgi:hypothetical protein
MYSMFSRFFAGQHLMHNGKILSDVAHLPVHYYFDLATKTECESTSKHVFRKKLQNINKKIYNTCTMAFSGIMCSYDVLIYGMYNI